jgi:hypothetical protein
MHTSHVRVLQRGIRTVSVSRTLTLEVPHFVAQDPINLKAWIDARDQSSPELKRWEPEDDGEIVVHSTGIVGHPYVVDHPMSAAERILYDG